MRWTVNVPSARKRAPGPPTVSAPPLGHQMKGMKIVAILIGGLLLLAGGVLVESRVRSSARKSIPVVVEGDVRAEVRAYVQPDFLWSGEAWWIEFNSQAPLLLDLDGEWIAIIPPGTNTLYSNHDVNNTTEFNTNRWWKTPSRITVREQPQPSPAR